jgi:biopolymer transport protein ExbD
MLRRKRNKIKTDAELDITSFMNLMIVLVPVLLMMMVFSRITVVELQLPQLSDNTSAADIEQQQLEILVHAQGVSVFYPQGYLIKDLPMLEQGYDYESLQYTLRQVKQTLINKDIDKKEATLLLADDVPYQVIVALMDATRSYPDVVAASVVDAELFPDISLADAPPETNAVSLTASNQ